mmetsp:Transcript_2772/g.9770  ORF Transcript_2772/g.9770 Transcript_2772/m.9770 type:complete len:282 (+) Transcript_2772:2363-3208(+)
MRAPQTSPAPASGRAQARCVGVRFPAAWRRRGRASGRGPRVSPGASASAARHPRREGRLRSWAAPRRCTCRRSTRRAGARVGRCCLARARRCGWLATRTRRCGRAWRRCGTCSKARWRTRFALPARPSRPTARTLQRTSWRMWVERAAAARRMRMTRMREARERVRSAAAAAAVAVAAAASANTSTTTTRRKRTTRTWTRAVNGTARARTCPSTSLGATTTATTQGTTMRLRATPTLASTTTTTTTPTNTEVPQRSTAIDRRSCRAPSAGTGRQAKAQARS